MNAHDVLQRLCFKTVVGKHDFTNNLLVPTLGCMPLSCHLIVFGTLWGCCTAVLYNGLIETC